MSLLEQVWSAYENEGLQHVLKNGPKYLKSRLFYRPFGEIKREAMISWCRDEGRIWHYGSEIEFEITRPINKDPPEKFLPYLGPQKVAQPFVCEIPNVRLLGKYAIPQLENGEFLIEEMDSVGTLQNRLRATYDTRRTRFKETYFPSRHDLDNSNYDVVLNLVSRHVGGPNHQRQGNYGHWLAEDLPRLRGYYHYAEQTDRKPLILVQQDPPSWMVETLELIGISSSEWVEWTEKSTIVSKLITPRLSNYHSRGTAFDPGGRKWVSDQMKSRIDVSDTESLPNRIFTSRQGQGMRSIVNFDEVKEILQEFDFFVIEPEEHSLEEQIQLFHQADVIAGPFGANLTNMIFAEEASVIEIFPYDEIRPVYFITANEQGFDYYYITGEPTEGLTTRNKNSDILVDTSELHDTIQKLDNQTKDNNS